MSRGQRTLTGDDADADGPSANGSRRLGEVLGSASAAAYGALLPHVVGTNGSTAGGGWVGVDDLLAEPAGLEPVLEAAGRRFRSDDRTLVGAQVARECVSILVTAAVQLWASERRLLDMSAANVALREGTEWVELGLRRLRVAVLPGDPLAGPHPDVEVVDEAVMLRRLLDHAIGRPVPLGSVPPGPPDQVAAVAAVIATVRRLMRCGDRHFWGSAALAAGGALTNVSHTDGERAARDLDTLLAARPDLARTVDLVTVDDTLGGKIVFPLRRTCCLLYKLPDQTRCGTCSLRDRDECEGWTGDYYREERRRLRPA